MRAYVKANATHIHAQYSKACVLSLTYTRIFFHTCTHAKHCMHYHEYNPVVQRKMYINTSTDGQTD